MHRYDVGDIAPLRLVIDPAGDDTSAELIVRPPDGPPFPVAVSPNGPRTEWRAGLRLTGPGLWRATWSVTGTGAGVETSTVSVRPDPSGGRTYATTADLAGWLGDAVPELAPTLLVRATRVVDRLTRGLVFAPRPGTDNLPADDLVAAALRDGTCAQAAAWIAAGYADDEAPDAAVFDDEADTGDDDVDELADLAAAGVTNVNLGGVSFGLTKAATVGASAAPDWTTPATDTTDVLRLRGVYPVHPRVVW